MLPLLPPELLSHILVLLASPSHASFFPSRPAQLSAHSSRNETLRHVCLASKQLCALAQPLLWRHLLLPSSVKKGKRFLEALETEEGRRWAEGTRSVDANVEDLKLVKAILGVAREVEEFRLVYNGTGVFDLGLLQNLHKLTSLTLLLHRLSPLPSTFRLPSLDILTLDAIKFESDADVERLLSPEVLPSLRRLTYKDCRVFRGRDAQGVPGRLRTQLKTFETSMDG